MSNKSPDSAAGATIDAVAQAIRVVDGNHDLGAGALAEALVIELAERGYRVLKRSCDCACPIDTPVREPEFRARLSMTDCLLAGNEDAHEADQGYACNRHFSRLRSSLLELPAIATWLAVNIAAGGSGLHDKVTGSSEDPIPLRPDILDLIGPAAPNPTAAFTRDEDDRLTWEAIDQSGDPGLFDETRSWAALVEQETGDDWDDRRTLTGAVSYLAAHLSWIVQQPWVDEFAAKIHELGRRAHHVAPWRTELIRANEACEDCGVQAVVIHLGEGFRRCEPRGGGCGRQKKLSEYEYRVILPEHRSAG